jgi:hypothetical protein
MRIAHVATTIVAVVLSKREKQASNTAGVARQLRRKAPIPTQRGIKHRRRTAGSTGFEHVVLLAFLLQVLLGVVRLLVVAFALERKGQ